MEEVIDTLGSEGMGDLHRMGELDVRGNCSITVE